MSTPNYYKDLGVKSTASADEIKQAYHHLAKKYHPDTNHGNKKAEEKLKNINAAYAILKNKTSRAKYDSLLRQEQELKKQKNTSQNSKPSAVRPYTSQPTETTTSPSVAYKRSWRKIIIHEMFALLCLFLYGWLLYINTDPQDPYNIAKTLRNTGNMLVQTISSAQQKSDEIYHSSEWKHKMLFFVTTHNQPILLDKLLTYWHEADIYDEHGYSLLMRAPTTETAQVILKHHANVNYQAPDGQTAFSLAVRHDNHDMMKILRKHGARIIWKK